MLISNLIDNIRKESNQGIDKTTRSQLGQFMTPFAVSNLMASFFDEIEGNIRLLDAGAGVGSLTASLLERATCEEGCQSVSVHAYEINEHLVTGLQKSADVFKSAMAASNVDYKFNLHCEDFIEKAVELIKKNEKSSKPFYFDKAILNPPYLKIGAKSSERMLCKEVNIDACNLYSAFVALAVKLLRPNGELVAIIPRSFCNGVYFKAFRKLLLKECSVNKIRIFESRTKAFKEDKVLQETVIIHLVKNAEQGLVELSKSQCAEDDSPCVVNVDFKKVVYPNDPNHFIHIITSDEEARIASLLGKLASSLDDLNLNVSTGRVVDFRNRKYLHENPNKGSVPFVRASHFTNGYIQWPLKNHKKPDSISNVSGTTSVLLPRGFYVLTKRMSSKEEKKRIVSAVYDPELICSEFVGFDNKTNFFHSGGSGIERNVAKGLSVYLSSTIVDSYFRLFNGHTQVNATDLRFLNYPSLAQLREVGGLIKSSQLSDQIEIDRLINDLVFNFN